MRSQLRNGFTAVLAVAASVACGGDSPTAPRRTTDVAATAARFDRVADSLSSLGDEENASVARGMAELVRTIGRIDEVVVNVDGRAVTHAAIGMELLVAESACATSPDPDFCRMFNPAFTQYVIGWSDLDLREGFTLTTERVGTTSVSWEDSPDFYTFAGVAYFRRDENADPDGMFGVPARIWFSEQGTVTTAAGTRGAACQTSGELQPGQSFACHQVWFSPSFDVTATALTFDAAEPPPVHLVMTPQRVDGLSIDITDVWDDGAWSVSRTARLRAATAKVRGLLWRVSPAFVGARATR